VNITVAQARAFCTAQGKRLPTELEWERAARKLDGGRYPWGNVPDATKANVKDNNSLPQHALMPVKSFEPYPVYQMAGNVWEMMEGEAAPRESELARFATLMPPATASERWIQVRGGSFNTPLTAAVTYEWMSIPERYSADDIGFRCAKNR
jgi:formylglycine-generating enzyme required for sulfatase activity